MKPDSLDEWLRYLDTLHPTEIDLGLERVRQVATAMELLRPQGQVITVAGTNGKGSVCAFLEAILRANDVHVGLYTSPHLYRFNERIRVDGASISDAAFCAALARVEAARNGTSLTPFEFVTLAALDHFATADLVPDVLILEVGLGGRLDAVNIITPDVAVITSIGLDHTDWLGNSVASVAAEKAGIARRNRAAICGDPAGPPELLQALQEQGATILRAGCDFGWTVAPERQNWRWQGQAGRILADLPMPKLSGGYQTRNAAVALAALAAIGRLPIHAAAARGIRDAHLNGRFQILPGVPETILDVSHNVQAAEALACSLQVRPCAGRTHLVLGMYADKDIAGVVERLAPVVDCWYAAGLPQPRGLASQDLAATVTAESGRPCLCFHDPEAAFRAAQVKAGADDRIVVAGSFVTVAEVGRLFL